MAQEIVKGLKLCACGLLAQDLTQFGTITFLASADICLALLAKHSILSYTDAHHWGTKNMLSNSSMELDYMKSQFGDRGFGLFISL